jgi:hypothetical protein
MRRRDAILISSCLLAHAALASAELEFYTIVSGELNRVDLVSHMAVPVGPVNHEVVAIAFTPDSRLFGIAVDSDSLIEIDLATGAGSIVGPLGVDVDTRVQDLAADDEGDLWMLDQETGVLLLYRIDPRTGAATLQCEPAAQTAGGLSFRHGAAYISGGTGPPDPGCGLEYCGHPRWLETGPEGWFYGVGALPQWWFILFRIDPSTCESEPLDLIFALGWGGLAARPERSQEAQIPALNPRGVFILAALVALTGVVILQRLHRALG